MNLNIKINWLYGLVAVGLMCSSAQAAVVYEDTFFRNIIETDGSVTTVENLPLWPRRESNLNPNTDWYTIYNNTALGVTDAQAGDGLLTIRTSDRNSGIISQVQSQFNFFNQELTYTFDGISIEAVGASRTAAQWVKFGVVANSDRVLWAAYPFFLVTYSGTGSFSFQVKQPLVDSRGFDTEPRKDFKSSVFNFDVSKLRKVELTMDSVNYRVKFSFETELDVLSFAGPHNLNSDLWFVDKVGVNNAQKQMKYAASRIIYYEGLLADAQANNGDVVAAEANVAAWQQKYDDYVVLFEEKQIEAEVFKGNSALMMTVSSDAQTIVNLMTETQLADYQAGLTEVGAKATINSVTVETTTTLEGF